MKRPAVVYLRKLCLAWGTLWIGYNVILLVEGLVWFWLLRDLAVFADHLYCRTLFGDKLWSNIYYLGVLTNVLFCPGPVAEAYIYIFRGRRIGRWRYFLFAAPLMFCVYIVFGYGMRGWMHVSGYLR